MKIATQKLLLIIKAVNRFFQIVFTKRLCLLSSYFCAYPLSHVRQMFTSDYNFHWGRRVVFVNVSFGMVSNSVNYSVKTRRFTFDKRFNKLFERTKFPTVREKKFNLLG